MYFIPRNNAIYHYIAHTSAQRRYIATLFILVLFGSVCFYGLYKPLNEHIVVYKNEIAQLQKQYDEMQQLDKNSKNLASLVETGKKNVAEYAIEHNQREEYCHKRMMFVLDTIAKSGLTLNVYGSCKEKDKAWYTKNSAHFEITGTFEKIMSFLKTIQESQQMITVSHVDLVRVTDNVFKLGCDIGIITVSSSVKTTADVSKGNL